MRLFKLMGWVVLASVMSANMASAESNLKAVVDTRGKTVITKDMQCVRHKWNENKDECAPEPAPAPAPVPVAQPAPPPPPPAAPQIALEQRTVYFDFDKAALTGDAQTKLNALSDIVKNSKGITKASVVGYADIIGKNDYNVKLSEKRARNTQAYLASHVTIPVDVLSVRGLGSTNPTTHCPKSMKRTERIGCLAQDRRVEVEFTYEK